MTARADEPAMVGTERIVTRAVSTLIGGEYLRDLTPDEVGALARLADAKGITPWVFIRCRGHDAGRHSRVRLHVDADSLSPAVSVEFDTRGALLSEVFEDADGDYATGGDPERLRFICPADGCGKSGSHHSGTLRGMILAALIRHHQDHQAGKKRPAAMSWWHAPAA